MGELKIDYNAVATAPTWRRVAELADLTEIFDPNVQVCSWQRVLDPAIGAYLSGLQQSAETQTIEALKAEAQPKLDGLPDGGGRDVLAEDLALLGEILRELLGCPEAGMRFARMGHAMCPGWHIDRTGIRLVSTYQGPGTQWLDDQTVDRCRLRDSQLSEKTLVEASSGEIVLLKGSLWQGNDRFGAVHRSPEVAANAPLRAVVTLDALWRD